MGQQRDTTSTTTKSTPSLTATSLPVLTITATNTTTQTVTLPGLNMTITTSVPTTIPTTVTESLTILDPPNIWMLLALILIIFMLLGASLTLRARYLGASGDAETQRRLVLELRNQATQPGMTTPASGALSRLLEMGVLQPKEYMEKKMIADALERKANAKRLLEEGLISNQQYEALIHKEEG